MRQEARGWCWGNKTPACHRLSTPRPTTGRTWRMSPIRATAPPRADVVTATQQPRRLLSADPEGPLGGLPGRGLGTGGLNGTPPAWAPDTRSLATMTSTQRSLLNAGCSQRTELGAPVQFTYSGYTHPEPSQTPPGGFCPAPSPKLPRTGNARRRLSCMPRPARHAAAATDLHGCHPHPARLKGFPALTSPVLSRWPKRCLFRRGHGLRLEPAVGSPTGA